MLAVWGFCTGVIFKNGLYQIPAELTELQNNDCVNFRVACWNPPWAPRNGLIVPNVPNMPCVVASAAADLSVQHEASLFDLGGRALEHWDLLFLDQLQSRHEESEQRHRRAVRVQPPSWQHGGEDFQHPKGGDLLEVDDLRTLDEHATYSGTHLGREPRPLPLAAVGIN